MQSEALYVAKKDKQFESLKKASVKANKRATIRDMKSKKNEKEPVNLPVVNAEAQKANEQGFLLVSKKKVNKATFSQMLDENLEYLYYKDYLTNAEVAFLSKIATLLELHSNAIVDRNTGQYLSITELAKRFNLTYRRATELINSLINKGIIYDLTDALTIKLYGHAVKERPLFINPELYFKGDRNRINATLSRLVINADHLERAGIKLPWKIWLKAGAETGSLYRRKSYLEFKKKSSRKQ